MTIAETKANQAIKNLVSEDNQLLIQMILNRKK